MNDLNPLDKSNFRQFILDTPSQFKVGIDLSKNTKLDGSFSSLSVSGMGGSALRVDLLQTYCSDIFNSGHTSFEILLNRYYKLSPQAKKKGTLNIVSSYSGNTEEAISSLEELHSLGLP